ncbi:DSBA-like thioredoxin domain protein [Pseudovibrio sp. Ad13]|uniref:DsbA family protein n=1 Tax=Pseudovibrio sp. Ad13 TaxID=989396 RepID=UPI0007AE6018|nr:DsbA family protein [Pseudovibrio sp. Ad13]KZK85056.1 DSBA-like thioredoxin domain protein [Pseudovibrio sp. Ad13]
MTHSFLYIYDPLCGWCYGAAPRLADLEKDYEVEMLPAGLFSGAGARPLDHSFASYAWASDQKIARLTGQTFSRAYQSQILNGERQTLDSTFATLAMTACSIVEPARGPEALKLIQDARYVEGKDITDLSILLDLLSGAGFVDAATLLQDHMTSVEAETSQRVAYGQVVLNQMGARGVPTLVADMFGERVLLPTDLLYGSYEQLTEALNNFSHSIQQDTPAL